MGGIPVCRGGGGHFPDATANGDRDYYTTVYYSQREYDRHYKRYGYIEGYQGTV